MALSNGHIILCADRNRRGGVKSIYLTECTNITATTVGTDHAYSGIAGLGGSTAGEADIWKFECDRETAYFTANATKENGSTIVDVEVGFTIPKITPLVQARLEDLKGSCGLACIVETYADDGAASPTTYHFVMGYDEIFTHDAYVEFQSGEQNTGQGLQDANETVLKFYCKQAEYPRGYTGTIAVEAAATNAFKAT
jgi:hypothetical protein